jgi:hypothetical protein
MALARTPGTIVAAFHRTAAARPGAVALREAARVEALYPS